MSIEMVSFTRMSDATTVEMELIASEAAKHRRENLVPSLVK